MAIDTISVLSAKVQIKSGPNSLPTLFFVVHEHFRVHPIIKKVILALFRYLFRDAFRAWLVKNSSFLSRLTAPNELKTFGSF